MGTPVTVRSRGTFRNEVTMGTHTLVADEPVSAGGMDEGPTPYDLLAAALGTCTSMTLQFYALREKIPLEGVTVTLTHDRKHAKDCADCLTTAGFVHEFEVVLSLEGPLSAEQREKLFTVATRCPVYKTFTSEIRVRERLA